MNFAGASEDLKFCADWKSARLDVLWAGLWGDFLGRSSTVNLQSSPRLDATWLIGSKRGLDSPKSQWFWGPSEWRLKIPRNSDRLHSIAPPLNSIERGLKIEDSQGKFTRNLQPTARLNSIAADRTQSGFEDPRLEIAGVFPQGSSIFKFNRSIGPQARPNQT